MDQTPEVASAGTHPRHKSTCSRSRSRSLARKRTAEQPECVVEEAQMGSSFEGQNLPTAVARNATPISLQQQLPVHSRSPTPKLPSRTVTPTALSHTNTRGSEPEGDGTGNLNDFDPGASLMETMDGRGGGAHISSSDIDSMLDKLIQCKPGSKRARGKRPKPDDCRGFRSTSSPDAAIPEQGAASRYKASTFPVTISRYREDGGKVKEELEDQGYKGKQGQVVYPECLSTESQRTFNGSLEKNSGSEVDPPIGSDGIRCQPDYAKLREPDRGGENDGETDRDGKFPPSQRAPAASWISRPSTKDVSSPQAESPTHPPSTSLTVAFPGSAQPDLHKSNASLELHLAFPAGASSMSGHSPGQHQQMASQSRSQSFKDCEAVTDNDPPALQSLKHGKADSVHSLGLRHTVEEIANEAALPPFLNHIRESVSPVLSALSTDPNLVDTKLHTFPGIHELKAESVCKLREEGQPNSDNLAVSLERRSAVVINTYPFAKVYSKDIGPEIDPDSLEPHPFARGAFGDVRRAFLRDGRQIAIKCLRVYTSDTSKHKLQQKLLREIRVWSHLKHDNVLSLLGLCVVNNELSMVSELMPNGNLQDYIRRNPAVDRYCLAIHVCEGLAYLHEHKRHVVHGDLKAANVVVDASGIPKLMDFGLAQMIRAEDSTGPSSSSSSARGTARWMAHELICPVAPNTVCCKPNQTSDVYSLGMTIYEIFAGLFPFANRKGDPQVIAAIMRRELPERVPNVFTDRLWELLLRCWQLDPHERPTAREVLIALQDLSRIQGDFINGA